MADKACEHCAFRERYDVNRKSILGRLWRWHAGWCPGWKSYMMSIPDKKRMQLAERYGMEKYR